MSADALAAVGIDVSQKKLDVALMREGAKAKFKSFPNTADGHASLLEWLEAQNASRTHSCLEATGTFAVEVANVLHDAGHTVSVVNPARIHAFGKSQLRRTKNDKIDSLLIAQFCHMHRPPAWEPEPLPIRQLRGLARRVEHLDEMRTMEKNRLGAGGLSAAVEQSLHEHIAYLEEQIEKTHKQIQDHINQDHINKDPDLKGKAKLLESIPGIGKVTTRSPRL